MKHNLLVSQKLSEFLVQHNAQSIFFTHDVTFGQGQAAILSSNKSFADYYNHLRIPFIYTDQKGRSLDDGVYVSQYLFESAHEFAEKYYPTLRSKFTFNYCLLIAENQVDSQHLYTFYFNTDELRFVQHVINNVQWYKNFIRNYRTQLKDLISLSCESCLEYPYMDLPAPDNLLLDLSCHFINSSSMIESLSIQQEKCFQLLQQGFSSKEIALVMQLSPRTIEHYIATIKRKLGCKNSKELLLKYKLVQ